LGCAAMAVSRLIISMCIMAMILPDSAANRVSGVVP